MGDSRDDSCNAWSDAHFRKFLPNVTRRTSRGKPLSGEGSTDEFTRSSLLCTKHSNMFVSGGADATS